MASHGPVTMVITGLLLGLLMAGAAAQVDIRSSSCPNLIKQRQTGTCVKSLQNLLKSKGFNPGTVDGIFGPNTLVAVRSFQRSRPGLEVDGIVGPATKKALYTGSGPATTPSTGVACSAAEFKQAITSNGFRSQPDSKRVNMLASIKQLGGSAVIATRRELAMWMAQIIHESDGLRAISEINGPSKPYAPYYGRGYIQLTGKANYQTASTALYGDSRLVKTPSLITSNDKTAWDVSTHYWKTRVHKLAGVSTGKFGATTKGINGNECRKYPDRTAKRCRIYKKVLVAFGVKEAADCTGCL